MKYQLQLNNLVYHGVFKSPTINLLNIWAKEWLGKYSILDYKVMLVGGTAEKLFGTSTNNTTDIDIVLLNDIKDPEHLYNIQMGAIELGFKHNVLIDIFHSTSLHNINNYIPTVQTRCYTEIRSTNLNVETVTKLYRDEHIIKRYQCGLTSASRNTPTRSYKKNLKYFQKGIYQNLKIDLKETIKWK